MLWWHKHDESDGKVGEVRGWQDNDTIGVDNCWQDRGGAGGMCDDEAGWGRKDGATVAADDEAREAWTTMGQVGMARG
jgi:hypothetical protein